MNAQEAKQKSNENLNKAKKKMVSEILLEIDTAVEDGLFSVTYTIPSEYKPYVDVTVQFLEHEGYKVTRNNGYDEHYNYSWNCLTIDWK